MKSDEIPENNDEPVKVVVRKSFNQMVLDSGKNGMCRDFQLSFCIVAMDAVLVFECLEMSSRNFLLSSLKNSRISIDGRFIAWLYDL